MAFFVIKIIIAVITAIVLGAATVHGAASYAEYCNDDDENDHYFYYYFNNPKLCDFSNDEREHEPDVDFLAVVIVTGICAFFWVSS